MKEKIRKVKIKKKKNLRQNQKRKKLKKIQMMRKNLKVEGHLHQGNLNGPNGTSQIVELEPLLANFRGMSETVLPENSSRHG